MIEGSQVIIVVKRFPSQEWKLFTVKTSVGDGRRGDGDFHYEEEPNPSFTTHRTEKEVLRCFTVTHSRHRVTLCHMGGDPFSAPLGVYFGPPGRCGFVGFNKTHHIQYVVLSLKWS